MRDGNLLSQLRRVVNFHKASNQAQMCHYMEDSVKRLPKIVCLCGSTRFKDAFIKAQKEETLKGHIVLTVGCFAHSGDDIKGKKEMLDELHKRKIDLADEVIVLTLDGYIGKSTQSEIDYAKSLGVSIRYEEST